MTHLQKCLQQLRLVFENVDLDDVPDAVCPIYQKAAHHHVFDTKHMQSAFIESQTLDMSPDMVTSHRRRLAMLVVLMLRIKILETMHSVCDGVELQGGRLIVFTERARYDETPKRASMHEEALLKQAADLVGIPGSGLKSLLTGGAETSVKKNY